jgi:prepilin-type N-terminal cleavage/methylation domain-containing protein
VNRGLRKKGFTLIEAMAAVLILSIGIVAVYGGMNSLTRAEARARDQDLVQRLADEKYEELISTEPDLSAPQNGNFDDRNLPDFNWEMESTPSGIESLQSITVRVEPRVANDQAPTGLASGLVYVPPVTSTTGATP